jgi:uncharacterized coiled-coil DUF342 family protein
MSRTRTGRPKNRQSKLNAIIRERDHFAGRFLDVRAERNKLVTRIQELEAEVAELNRQLIEGSVWRRLAEFAPNWYRRTMKGAKHDR